MYIENLTLNGLLYFIWKNWYKVCCRLETLESYCIHLHADGKLCKGNTKQYQNSKEIQRIKLQYLFFVTWSCHDLMFNAKYILLLLVFFYYFSLCSNGTNKNSKRCHESNIACSTYLSAQALQPVVLHSQTTLPYNKLLYLIWLSHAAPLVDCSGSDSRLVRRFMSSRAKSSV